MKFRYDVLFLTILAFTVIQVQAQSKTDSILTIYFDSNIDSLNSLQIRSIRNFTSSFHRIDKVIGYADTVGSTGDNFLLAKRRALNTCNLIKSLGNNSIRDTVFKGEDFQQAKDLTENRKVEIFASGITQATEKQKAADSIIEVLELDNIFFVPDNPIITQQSIPYVNALAGRIINYKNARFEIVGHVNYQSTKKGDIVLQDLFKLSEQRAKLIHDILIERGISPNKVSYKGVGNTQPMIANPKNDEERERNMRVQVLVIRL